MILTTIHRNGGWLFEGRNSTFGVCVCVCVCCAITLHIISIVLFNDPRQRVWSVRLLTRTWIRFFETHTSRITVCRVEQKKYHRCRVVSSAPRTRCNVAASLTLMILRWLAQTMPAESRRLIGNFFLFLSQQASGHDSEQQSPALMI